MSVDRHPDWYEVVRANWSKTQGFLLASREPCLAIRRQELEAVKGRALAGRDPQDLERWTPPASWVLGVVLCPGDSIAPLVDWMRRNKATGDRVWFFLHPTTPIQVLRPWAEAGYETDQAVTVTDWRELHKLFGLALNDRVYEDWNQG